MFRENSLSVLEVYQVTYRVSQVRIYFSSLFIQFFMKIFSNNVAERFMWCVTISLVGWQPAWRSTSAVSTVNLIFTIGYMLSLWNDNTTQRLWSRWKQTSLMTSFDSCQSLNDLSARADLYSIPFQLMFVTFPSKTNVALYNCSIVILNVRVLCTRQ